MIETGSWTRLLPLLLWITGIVGAWIALLLSVIRMLLNRSVQQIDNQFLDLRQRLVSLEDSLGGTNQKVTSLELKLQQEISKLREEIQGGYLRKDEWLRDERHREEIARRCSTRLEALEEAFRTGRAMVPSVLPSLHPHALPMPPWPHPYSAVPSMPASPIHPPQPQPPPPPFGDRAAGASLQEHPCNPATTSTPTPSRNNGAGGRLASSS